MTKNRENRKIALKEKQWDIALASFDIWCGKVWKELKRDWKIVKKMIDWYFFYQPKSKGDRAWHVILWILYTLAGLRIFRFI
jgi:hypothetical protein